MELVVASGKGGTGKTSLVGSFAELAGDVILVDCDVDAANLHLIVPHKVLEKHSFSTSKQASINERLCKACGVCHSACRFDAVKYYGEGEKGQFFPRYEIDPLGCEGCGLCSRLCPEGAISFEEVISGEWYRSRSAFGPFLHARLGIAQSNSGRLASLLRREAADVSASSGDKLIIVDAPPGIGCPVIATITGASYLLIVTEPSLSAIHDMRRLLELASHFGIRTGLCINKYDINPVLSEQIEQLAKRDNIPVHGKIAFDPTFVQAQIDGQPYVRLADKIGVARINGLWQSVYRELNNATVRRRFVV